MKNVIIACLLFVVGCGFSSKQSEMVGQVKKIINNTPIICPDYPSLDLSLGVMRNGTGSVSTQDVYAVIGNADALIILKAASEQGLPVKVTFDTRRFSFCQDELKVVTKAEVLK